MNQWAPKVFWTEVQVVAGATAGHFSIALDGRPVRTPAKAPLALPTRAAADLVADEWRAQRGKIDPETMPHTRTANAAIDKVAYKAVEVAGLLSDYCGTDLLCYRAAAPQTLVARQAAGWDPLLDWAATALGARLVVTVGVMPVAQDAAVLDGLRARIEAMDAFRLAAFHDLVSLSGSAILAFAVALQRLTPQDAWALATIDETHQAEQWGADDEAAEKAERKRAAFESAARFFGSISS